MTEEEEMAFEMADEYDFSSGMRNPYSLRAKMVRGEVVVTLTPDLAGAFPTGEALNAALWEYLKVREAA